MLLNKHRIGTMLSADNLVIFKQTEDVFQRAASTFKEVMETFNFKMSTATKYMTFKEGNSQTM